MKTVFCFFKGKSEEFWWRILSSLFSVFIVVPNIALLIFLVYMAEYDFFSYDFFVEGIFAMKWFFITTVIFISVLSIVIYSPLLLYCLYKKRGFNSKWLWLCSVFFFLIWQKIILSICEGSDIGKKYSCCRLVLLYFCILLCLHAPQLKISL